MQRAFFVAGLLAGLLGAQAKAQDALTRVYQGHLNGSASRNYPAYPTSYYQSPYGYGYSAPAYGTAYGGQWQTLPSGGRAWNGPVQPRYTGSQGLYSPTPQRINRPSGLGTTRR